MPLAAESNNLEDFEILGSAYLDPLLRRHHFAWIGVFENDNLLVSRGAECEPSYLEPIEFKNIRYGSLGVRENNPSDLERIALKEVSAQIAPLMAWLSPWAPRLMALQIIDRLRKKHSDFNWTGIYRNNVNEKNALLLSLFLGAPTEHIEIPISEGICGAAVRENKTLNIPNVRADPRFIACSVTTQSELVVPIRNSKGLAIAEIDIDSDSPDAFTPEKIADVEAAAEKLSQIPQLF